MRGASSDHGLFQPLPRGSATGRVLLATTVALIIFGTVFVASASEGQAVANGGSAFSIVAHDLAYLCFGIFAWYVAARVRLERIVALAPTLIGGGLALLFAVKLVGVSTNGGKRWLDLRVINLQPSELFKLCAILYVAWLVQHHHRDLDQAKSLVVRTAPIWLGCALIVLEPDIGTASVVLMIAVATLASAGLSGRLLVRATLVTGVGVGAYLSAKPYAAQRLFSFLHPNANLLGSGYQLLQSRIGLGAGGLTGLGLGNSREKFGLLPNPHTDFIFTIVGEELGLIGTLAVIALFVVFLMVSVRIAQQCANPVNRLVAVGVMTWIMVEAIINIASVVGWWAVTGVPLPFFSYGGTALITEMAAVGLLYNVAHDRSRGPDVTLESSGGARRRRFEPAPRPPARAGRAFERSGAGNRSRAR